MRYKHVSFILSILIFLIFLTGCGIKSLDKIVYYNLDEEEDIDSDFIVVGFSQLGSESAWRTAHTKSIQDSLSENENFYLIFLNARQNQENQIKAVRNFISQEVDYIVIAPETETGWDTVLKEAKESGIPVIIADRMVDVEDDSLYLTHVGSDLYQEGIKAGEWLEQYLEKRRKELNDKLNDDEEINIVVLEGTLNSTAQIGRTNGFNYVAARNERWNILAQESEIGRASCRERV